LVALNSSLE